MHELHAATRMIEIAALGERLSALRLCDAEARSAVRRSLEQYGQLAAVTLFAERDGLQIMDGFKRVRAARALQLADVDRADRRRGRGRREAAPARAARAARADRARGGVAGALALPRGSAAAARDRATDAAAPELGLAPADAGRGARSARADRRAARR